MVSATVKRYRASLGWTFHGTRYWQMTWEANKVKRLQFAKDCLAEGETLILMT